jgi:PAS domain S-box-containing protein
MTPEVVQEKLQARVAATEEALRALVRGEADALVVETERGPLLLTIDGADSPYRMLVEQMPLGVAMLDHDGTILYANPKLGAMLGARPGEIVGSKLADLVPPSGRAAATRALQRQESGWMPALSELRNSGGATFPVGSVLGMLPGQDGATACVIIADSGDLGPARGRPRPADGTSTLMSVEWIRAALAEEHFVLYAQPTFDLRSGLISHHELLIRMVSGDGDPILPALFLPTAERSGLIHEIDSWVTRTGLDLALGGTPISINLSGASLGDQTQTIVAAVRAAVTNGLDPANVIFEVTETATIANLTAARQSAEALKGLGCSLALDDFGAGFAPFTYLRHMPARYLKICMEFVQGAATNAVDRQLIKAIVEIARGLGQSTIAEGVEDAQTLELVRAYGVDYAQGYHLGRPVRIYSPTSRTRSGHSDQLT